MGILKQYEELASLHWVTPLFPPNVMLEIIEACQKADLRIYGFDGFKLWENDGIQPFMEHSVDYSNIEDKQEIFRMSREFIVEKADLGLLFEIVVDGDDEPEVLARRAAKQYPQIVLQEEEARRSGDLKEAERLGKKRRFLASFMEKAPQYRDMLKD